jgi:hypothetical protein
MFLIADCKHFLEAPTIVAKITRILCRSREAYIGIHPFTAPSNRHNLILIHFSLRTLPECVDYRNHLRKRHLPFQVPPYEWRIHRHQNGFTKHFEITNHYFGVRDGEYLLTSDMLTDLPGNLLKI